MATTVIGSDTGTSTSKFKQRQAASAANSRKPGPVTSTSANGTTRNVSSAKAPAAPSPITIERQRMAARLANLDHSDSVVINLIGKKRELEHMRRPSDATRTLCGVNLSVIGTKWEASDLTEDQFLASASTCEYCRKAATAVPKVKGTSEKSVKSTLGAREKVLASVANLTYIEVEGGRIYVDPEKVKPTIVKAAGTVTGKFSLEHGAVIFVANSDLIETTRALIAQGGGDPTEDTDGDQDGVEGDGPADDDETDGPDVDDADSGDTTPNV